MIRSSLAWVLAPLLMASAQPRNRVEYLSATLGEVVRGSRDPVAYLTPDVLANGERAAKELLGMDRPTAIPEDRWEADRAAAYKTLGWAGIMSGDGEGAERAFLKCLQITPSDAEVSYEVVRSIYIQRAPAREPDAIFHLARAAVYEGPGALSASRREGMEMTLKSSYERYHGRDPAGLENIKSLARTRALPPPGFTIVARPGVLNPPVAR